MSPANLRATSGAIAERAQAYGIRLPDEDNLSQDREWIEFEQDGVVRRIRLHDYSDIYRVPGLYESLFARTLQCTSPTRVVGLLRDVMLDQGDDPHRLRVLDVGAGNGMVGYELQSIGVDSVFGTDIIEEARDAVERDRSWCYDGYLVADLTGLSELDEATFLRQRFNAMTCVAALGFGDIPAAAFVKAISLIESGGWVAFNIKSDFIQERDRSGFSRLLKDLQKADILTMQAYVRYQHRLALSGEPLYYVAMIARKGQEVSEEIMERWRA